MPSIVGNIKIVSVGPSSIVNIGDSFILTPISSNKTFAGANSFATGDTGFGIWNNPASSSNVLDANLVDMPRVI
jgi:spore germination protein PA